MIKRILKGLQNPRVAASFIWQACSRVIVSDRIYLKVSFMNNKVYFGELVFHHDGGVMPFIPEEWNAKLGSMINLKDY